MISINLKKRIYTASILFFLVFLIFNSKIIFNLFFNSVWNFINNRIFTDNN